MSGIGMIILLWRLVVILILLTSLAWAGSSKDDRAPHPRRADQSQCGSVVSVDPKCYDNKTSEVSRECLCR